MMTTRGETPHQEIEDACFRDILAELTKPIAQPAQATGRPRLPLADMVFICVYRTYTNLSSRRFIDRLDKRCTAGIVNITCHYNSVSNYLRDPLLTPVLNQLVENTSKTLGPFVSDADFDRLTDLFEGFKDFSKDDQARENEMLCQVL